MNRTLKVVVGGWGIALGIALLGFLPALFVWGPEKAEWVWRPIPLTILFIAGLLISARWLK